MNEYPDLVLPGKVTEVTLGADFDYDYTSGAQVNEGGTLIVADGGTAVSTTVADGGALEVLSGGILSGASVADAADLTVGSGAVIYDLDVAMNGTPLMIGSCAEIHGLNVSGAFSKNYAYGSVSSGTTIYDFNINGPYLAYHYGTVISGGSWGGTGLTTTNGSRIRIFNRGAGTIVSGVHLGSVTADNSLWVYIETGAVGKDIVVSKRARLQISATASDTVLSGGTMWICGEGNGISYNTINYGGKESIAYNNGRASGAVIYDGVQELNYICSGITEGKYTKGKLIYTGAKSYNTVIYGGSQQINGGWASKCYVPDDCTLTISGGAAYGTVLSGGTQIVKGIKSIYNSGGGVIDLSGGMAFDTVICDGASQTVESGGMAFDTVISSGGFAEFAAGASASGITMDGDRCWLVVNNGANVTDVAMDLDVNQATTATIRTTISGGTSGVINGLTISGVFNANSSGCWANISKVIIGDLRVSGPTTLNFTSVHIYGGVLDGTKLRAVDGSRGAFKFYGNSYISGLSMTNALNANGNWISAANSAVVFEDTIVSGNARLQLRAGGTARGTVLKGPGAYFYVYGESGSAYAYDTMVSSGGHFYIAAGGKGCYASNTTICNGGKMYYWADLVNVASTVDNKILAGGIANFCNTSKYKGYLVAEDNYVAGDVILGDTCVMKNTFVDDGGLVHVSSGGFASDTVIGSGGTLSKTTNLGDVINLELRAGAVVTMDTDVTEAVISGAVTFDLAGADASAAAVSFFTDRSYLDTAVTVTVEVNDLTRGNFTLWNAGAAEAESVTVVLDDGIKYTLAAGNEVYNMGDGVKYTLSVVDGVLSFAATEVVIEDKVINTYESSTSLLTAGSAFNNESDYQAELTGSFGTESDAATLYAGTGLGDANGWLKLDADFADASTKKSGKVYGGGKSGELNGATNINVNGASIGNLLGGGAAGAVDNDINIEVNNASDEKKTEIKALYGGGHGKVKGDINIKIGGGTISDKIVGGTIRTTADASVAGSVSLDISDVDFKGSTITGGNYANFATVTDATSVGGVDIAFAGGSATSASIYGAGYTYNKTDGAKADGTAEYTVNNGVNIELTGGNIGSKNGGRGIFGGAFAHKTDAAVTGGVNITVKAAGAGNIFGGGWAQQGGSSTVTGGVDITIESGSANAIYGGGAHSDTKDSGGTTSVDSVNITVKCAAVTVVYAGGQTTGDTVGNALVTVTGNFSTATSFYGTGWKDVDTVTGTSTLNFEDFSGACTGKIANFDEIIFSGDTIADLSEATLGANNGFIFDIDAERTAAGAFVNIGDLAVGSVDIRVDADLVVAGIQSWDLITTTGNTLSDFDLFIGDAATAIDLTVGTAVSAGTFSGWGVTAATDKETGITTYKFGMIA